ncbi:MAG: ABC transporter permease [Rhodocyclaceae bacterium]|nr:ABC transporter permease [Rhodocyclaceae bacterium]
MTTKVRIPLDITLAVWRAVFLREALERMFEARVAWMWLIIEPVIYIALHAFGYLALHVHAIGGMETSLWIITGFIAYLLWRRTGTQVTYALECNKPFFAYRQVKPFDAAIVRALLELFLMIPIAVAILMLAKALGHKLSPGLLNPEFLPRDPLLAIAGIIGIWLFGLGYGLINSVALTFVPDLDHVYRILILPLLYISGTFFPIFFIPQPYRGILLINPVVHGVELVRKGFLPTYHSAPEISLSYLFATGLGSILFGLILYRRYAKELLMQ